MRRPSPGRFCRHPRFLLLPLLLTLACSHDDTLREKPVSDKGGMKSAGEVVEDGALQAKTSSELTGDRLEAAIAPRPDEAQDEKPRPARKKAPPPGKLERMERTRLGYHYGGDPERAEEVAGEKVEVGEDGVIRIEAESYGTPGLVLVRAMSGAESLGYTVLSIEERDLYFVALKNPSFMSRFVGTQRGVCKIAVGTQKGIDDSPTRVVLRGRSQLKVSQSSCRSDLDKILRYARGEIVDKPRKRTTDPKRRPWNVPSAR